MINGMHALLYSRDVVAARAFLGDVLGLDRPPELRHPTALALPRAR